MNWLCVIILAVPVMYILKGFQKGMVKMAVSFLSVFITLAACFIFNPHIEKVLKQKTGIYEGIQKQCEKYILDTVEIQEEDGEINEEEQKAVIQRLPLSENISEFLFSENLSGEYGNVLAETFVKYLAGCIADFIIGAISLFLTFLFVSILMGILGKILEVIFSFPILSMMNRTGGAILGAAKGICMIWIFFLAISIFWNAAWAQNCYHLIRENPIVSYLYDENMFLYFLKGIMK